MVDTTITADAQAVKNDNGRYVIPDGWDLNDRRKEYYKTNGTFTGFVDGDGNPKDITGQYTYPTAGGGTTTPPPSTTPTELTQVVPGKTAGASQVNAIDYAGQVAVDPQVAFSNDMLLGQNTPQITEEQTAAGEVPNQASLDPNAMQAGTSTVDSTATASAVDPREAVGYEAATTQDAVAQNDMTAAQGTVSEGAQITAPQIDTEGLANGEGAVGQAINAAAILDLNDIDSRATLAGQLEILQGQFVDGSGMPTIPPWATGIARSISKLAAFKGITGSAATEAMSNALLEATKGIAEQDAKFFQTVTLTNLNNKQQSTINKANILAQMTVSNLDARATAAVENAKNFMAMDLANLNNDQQARMINTQQRFQSILEDSKAINASRLFSADSQNDMTKFYDALNSQLEQFNASQLNAMSQFNSSETNDMSQFNSQLANQRDLFYRTMQYNIDLANAQWRQTVTTTNTQMEFEAAAFDAKNMVDMSQEALNQVWDRSDALLDYVWKSAENKQDRDAALVIAKLQSKTQKDINTENQPGFGDTVGEIAGTLLGNWMGS